jgi:hypothetical protein
MQFDQLKRRDFITLLGGVGSRHGLVINLKMLLVPRDEMLE